MTRVARIVGLAVFLLLWLCCSDPGARRTIIGADQPIHLEEHITQAGLAGSEAPADLQPPVEWRFDRPRTDWTTIVPLRRSARTVRTVQAEDALRLVLDESGRSPRAGAPRYTGGISVNLPDWRREDWAYIVISARARCPGGSLTLVGRLNKSEDAGDNDLRAFLDSTESVDLIGDGQAHTYLIRADWSPGEYSGYRRWHDPWTQLGLEFASDKPATVDLLEVSVIPKEAKYAGEPAGAATEVRGIAYRRALFMHAPGSISYRARVPRGGRLDIGLGVLRDASPVTFRVTAATGHTPPVVLYEEAVADKTGWGQRSIDLAAFEGKTVDLSLSAECDRRGEVALWAAPTISGSRSGVRPNVILYVIDGGSADHMSVYGYNRRTTPHLERLAASGAVFERAYSNSSWTKVSAPSFMTSLHSSVLGALANPSDRLPPQAVTMAEHLHRAGYQTGVFVSNPHCGTMSGLERGVDVLREAGVDPNARSSEELQSDFWTWRREYPGTPFWAHIQATDVHMPWTQEAPFAGLFIDPAHQATYLEWYKRIAVTPGHLAGRFGRAGIDPVRFNYLATGLYDETMAHQDAAIGRLVDRLKAEGEWDHTLFIVAADHGSYGAGLLPVDPAPAAWGPANLAASVSHIPLIISWPGRIKPGQRLEQQVSLIDLLPTVLDLVGLPEPEVVQGRSLVPLFMGRGGWGQEPVILDEFNVRPDTGDLYGTIDVIDGRWGASLQVGRAPGEDSELPEYLRPAPLLLYDLWNDPQCLRSLHAGRPEMVRKYTDLLKGRFAAHRSLARGFTRAGSSPLNPEQIETLRTLGYIK
jgi:arylsulfatase A-like enzyme